MEKIKADTYMIKPLIRAVLEKFPEITKEELLGNRRNKMFSFPRQIMFYLAAQNTGYSLPRIGALLGRDHTTIMYAADKIREQRKQDPDLDFLITEIHHLALVYEVDRREQLAKAKESVEEMIYNIQMEKLNGLSAT